MKKITLDKKVVAVLTPADEAQIVGGNVSQAALDPNGDGVIWICNTRGECGATRTCGSAACGSVACGDTGISIDARTNRYVCD